MNSKRMLLLRTLLRSTGRRNRLKYTKDKKEKKKLVSEFIGFGLLMCLMAVYALIFGMTLGAQGAADLIPPYMSGVLTALALFFTFFKSNSVMFGFRGYEVTMAMPFSEKDIVGARFLYMYLKILPWFSVLGLSMFLGYALFAHAPFYSYILYVVLLPFIPLIPTLLASFLASLIAVVSARFRYKKAVEIAITILLVMAVLMLEMVFMRGAGSTNIEKIMETLSAYVVNIETFFPTVHWYRMAVEGDFLYLFMFLFGGILLYELFTLVIGKMYRNINSRLMVGVAKKNYRMTKQKSRSIRNAIVFKEFKRLTSSTVYFTNAALGYVMVTVISIAAWFVDVPALINKQMEGAYKDERMLALLPMLIFFMVNLVTTTAMTPSLEGKNYWIVDSLPIRKKDLYFGKLRFQLVMALPVTVLATISLSCALKVPFLTMLVYLTFSLTTAVTNALYGLIWGIKFMKLDWENEVEVIKQGPAMLITIFSSMILAMVFAGVATVTPSLGISAALYYGALTVLAIFAGLICYLILKAMLKNK